MKKVLGLIILSIMLVLSAFGLSACGHEHAYVDTVVAPTCVDKGYTLHKCECGESYTDTEVNALGHDFGDYVSDNNATYTSDGTKTATCDRDGCEGKDVINNPNDPAKAIRVFMYFGNEITGLTTYGKTLTELVIPARINDIEFISIYERAFRDCSSLQSIEIPASVSSIGNRAFSGCDNLQTVTFGENSQLTSIGAEAFRNCSSLEAIEIPASVTSIGGSAFSSCSSLKSIEIPEGVTSIGDHAFEHCSKLSTVIFGENSKLQSIEVWTFFRCSSLEAIEIPASVTRIGDYVFLDCNKLTSITVEENNQNYKSIDGNLYSKDGKALLQYPRGKTATTFTIPEGVTSIGASAFEYCRSLQSIEIPASVTSIGRFAFSNCSNLTTVTFGKNSQLTSIGAEAFLWCYSLQTIEIPASVTSIGDYAFYRCFNLTTVTFGENSQLTSVDDYAFFWCSNLTTIYYGGTASDWGNISIDDYYNDSLTSATIYYYVENESDLPTDGGNYWHYVDGVPTVWVIEE